MTNSGDPKTETPFPEWLNKAIEELTDAGKRFDKWATENPKEAAMLIGAGGLAGAMVLNKLLAIRGSLAMASALYGAGKGAFVGYSYPKVRTQSMDEILRMRAELERDVRNVMNLYSKAADVGREAKEAFTYMGREAKETMDEMGRDARDKFRNTFNEVKRELGLEQTFEEAAAMANRVFKKAETAFARAYKATFG